ncbi:phospholipase-like protein [Tanacetum coccineum]
MRLIKDIKELLEMNSNRLSLFSNSCFGVWLNVPFKDHDLFLIHSMLLNQQEVDEYHTEYHDLQVNVYKYILKFGHREFCICTGLKFGHYDLKPFDSALVVPFRDRVFGHANITVRHLKEAFDGDEWHNIDDVDVVRLCLVMFVEFVLLGREPKNNAHVHLLALVEDLDAFNQFPWGSYTWSVLYKSIRNAAWIHYHCVNVGDGAGEGGGKVGKLEKLKKRPNDLPPPKPIKNCIPRKPERTNIMPISTTIWDNAAKEIAELKDRINNWSGFGEVDLKVMVTRLANLESRMNGYDLNKNGGYCDRDIRMDSGVGMQDHSRVDTGVRMDTVVRDGYRFLVSSWVVLMDSGCRRRTARFKFFCQTRVVYGMIAPQFQDSFIRPVHSSTTIREQHVDVHIEAFVRLCVYKRPPDANWTAVDTFFTVNLINIYYERVIKYASGHFGYPNWKTCSVVYIHIHDEQSNHWYLAVFDIRGGQILFFDSYEALDIRAKPYFSSLLESYKVKLHFILGNMGWFAANNVDQSQYKITFCYLRHVPQQKDLYGDCGPLMLYFMRRMMSGYHVELVPNTIVYGRECRELLLEEFLEHRLDWMDPYQAYNCPCGAGSIVLRKSYQPHSLGRLYYACPRSKPSKQYYGCKYFIWKDDLDLQLRVSSSHGPSTPQGSSPGSSTNPSYYHELSTHPNSSPRSGPTECSNCKVKDLRIKMLEARLKMLETRLEMERHPEDHACQSAAMLHELLHDMENLRME